MRHITGRFSTIGIAEESGLGRRLRGLSWPLPLAAIALALVGLSTVASASTELTVSFSPPARQATWIGLGLVAMMVGFLLSHTFLLRWALPLYLAGLVSLVLILLFGHEAGGARSWVGFAGFGLQPSEFVKIAAVLVLARLLGFGERRRLETRDLLMAALILALPTGLLILQPDLGGALTFVPLAVVMVAVAGMRRRDLVVGAGIALVLMAVGWSFALQDYQRERVLTFLSPETDPLGSGYQLRQSKIAVGSGEVFGKGFMQGTQSQLRFLPARHTDFIFAVLAEEQGFVGVATAFGLYLLYLYGGLRIAARARDGQAILMVTGLLAVIVFHILYNTAMMIGFVPITGIPLPFLSYGGSFTIFCFFATGLMLGVDFRRYVNR